MWSQCISGPKNSKSINLLTLPSLYSKMALQYMGRRDRLQDGKSGIKLQMKGRVVEA